MFLHFCEMLFLELLYYYANIFSGLLTSMYETEGYIQTVSKWRIKQVSVRKCCKLEIANLYIYLTL